MHSHNHHLASVPGDTAAHPFDLNEPLEAQENLHAGDYFPHVQVTFATIIAHVKGFIINLLTINTPSTTSYCSR